MNLVIFIISMYSTGHGPTACLMPKLWFLPDMKTELNGVMQVRYVERNGLSSALIDKT